MDHRINKSFFLEPYYFLGDILEAMVKLFPLKKKKQVCKIHNLFIFHQVTKISPKQKNVRHYNLLFMY
jgi:hypothetical protein